MDLDSVIVALRLRRAPALGLRIVHVDTNAAAGIDDLHPVDVAAVEGDTLCAEDLPTGAAFDPAHCVRQGTLILATVVTIFSAALGSFPGITSRACAAIEPAQVLCRGVACRHREGGGKH